MSKIYKVINIYMQLAKMMQMFNHQIVIEFSIVYSSCLIQVLFL